MKKIYICILVFVSACAAWRAEDVPVVSKFSNDSFGHKGKISASIELKLYEFYVGDELRPNESTREYSSKFYKLTRDVYKDVKFFDIVDANSPNKELKIEISLIRKRESNLLTDVLTGMSLYLIPKRTNERITLITKYFDKQGELVGMVEKVETVVMWHQLFMLFALPFNIPNNVIDDTVLDLSRSSLLEAYNDGYFVELNS